MKHNFSAYKGVIKETLQQGKRTANFQKSMSDSMSFTSIPQKLALNDKQRDKTLFDSLHEITKVTGKVAKYHQPTGLHPDFASIKETAQPENHYITSVFIDINKSTRLFAKYYPATVANITSTIQRAAIHISWYFDSYVQRFHGDGLFLYFGGKSMTPKQSVLNALMSSSIFSKFVKEELPDIFLEQGVEDIYTRIGIDIGEDEDTLWYLAGMDQCSEVTTCSLHTSLAAHMQGNASRNGIMVGDNVKNKSGLNSDLFSIVKDSAGKEDRYIFQIKEENFNYTQWAFDWQEHLNDLNYDGIHQLNPANTSTVVLPSRNIEYLRSEANKIKPYSFE